MLDIYELFDNIFEEEYCIIRPSVYNINGTYEKGSDIDILCRDREELGNKIESCIRGNCPYKRFISPLEKLHIDIYDFDNVFELKFDIMDNFSSYKNVIIKDSFMDRILRLREFNGFVFIPNVYDDIILRLIEFYEHPNKEKHILYVNNKLKDLDKNLFNSLLEEFTNIR